MDRGCEQIVERGLMALVADAVNLIIVGEPGSGKAGEQIRIPVALGKDRQRAGLNEIANDIDVSRLVWVVPAWRGAQIADAQVEVSEQDRDEQPARRPGAKGHVAAGWAVAGSVVSILTNSGVGFGSACPTGTGSQPQPCASSESVKPRSWWRRAELNGRNGANNTLRPFIKFSR